VPAKWLDALQQVRPRRGPLQALAGFSPWAQEVHLQESGPCAHVLEIALAFVCGSLERLLHAPRLVGRPSRWRVTRSEARLSLTLPLRRRDQMPTLRVPAEARPRSARRPPRLTRCQAEGGSGRTIVAAAHGQSAAHWTERKMRFAPFESAIGASGRAQRVFAFCTRRIGYRYHCSRVEPSPSRDVNMVETMPTALERRALAAIWADVDPAVGAALFGPREPGLTADALFAHWCMPAFATRERPNLLATGLQPRTFRRDTEGFLIVSGVGARDRVYEAHLKVRDDGRVSGFFVGRAPPPGVVVRRARPQEYEAIAEIIRDAPVVTGERSFSIWLRRLHEIIGMQGDARVTVAERQSDGKLVAARLSAVREVILMGEPLTCAMAYQAAVLPEARGHGIENALLAPIYRSLWERVDVGFGYVDAGNRAILQAMGERTPLWTNTVRQIGIRAAADQSAFGRPASSADAPRILELLTRTHGQEELHPHYSHDWVARRFGTLASYGFDAVQMTDHAMLGLWSSGDMVVDVSPLRQRHARFAYIVDYGFDGDKGLDDLQRLIADARACAAKAGCTHVIAYTSEGSPGRAALGELAEFDDEMLLTIRLPEPTTISETGIYTDPFFI